MEILFIRLGLVGYICSLLFYFGYALTKREILARMGWTVLIAGILFHALSLIIRTIAGHQLPDHGWYAPWCNWFESLSFFILVIACEYLILQWREHWPILGAFVLPFIVTVMLVAVLSPVGTRIPMVPPKLQSFWMMVHVPVVLVSYGALALAFVVGHAYLLQERQIKSKKPSHLVYRLPSLDELENLVYRIILVAWPILLLGLILGALWGYEAWGRWWSWDAKEVSSALTLLIYTLYLFMRRFIGWRGRKSTYLSLVGFVAVLITFIGVNSFSKLHGFLLSVGR